MLQIVVKICKTFGVWSHFIRASNLFGSFCFSQRYHCHADIHLIRKKPQMLNRQQFVFVQYFTFVLFSKSFARHTLTQSDFTGTNMQMLKHVQKLIFISSSASLYGVYTSIYAQYIHSSESKWAMTKIYTLCHTFVVEYYNNYCIAKRGSS